MSPRRLWPVLMSRPWMWVVLLAWPALVLLGFLTHEVFLPGEGTALAAVEAGAVVSALCLLLLAGVVAARFYFGLRAVRDRLFEGDYEAAFRVASRHRALGQGMGLERALERLIEFDRRRAERVSAVSRLLDRLLREAPLPLLLGSLERSEIRFSQALCALFEVTESRFSIDSLLIPPANEVFARLWRAVASGEKTHDEGAVTLRLPVRQASRRLDLRLLAVQDDKGEIIYVLGFASPIGDAAPLPPEDQTAPIPVLKPEPAEDHQGPGQP